MALKKKEQVMLDSFETIDLMQIDNTGLWLDFCNSVIYRDYENRKYVLPKCTEIKNKCMNFVINFQKEAKKRKITQKELERLSEIEDIYWSVLLMEARNRQFDSYCLFLEKDREPAERFYEPRRMQLRKISVPQALQQLIDDELDILTISLVPGAGKTTIEKYFHSAVAGWFPKDFSLFYSHSGDITRMYYDGVYDIVTNHEEYTWDLIFPDLRVNKTNAKMEQFNVGKISKAFPSVQCTSVGSKNAGKVRASKFLFVDDMIGSIEEALNKNILDKRWEAYSVDARQRKTTDSDGKFCKEIHIATRWSVHDVIGRLQRIYEGDDRVKFLAVPDIDPETGKSNFDYKIFGYTAENFADIAKTMDEVSYRCLYKQDPIEREGLLYQDDELRRYMELPNREPDAVLGVCDTKVSGIDYMFLPVFYRYDNDYYLVDCICDDTTDFELQYERCTKIILDNRMQEVEFESNAGGSRIAFEVQDRVKKRGGTCNITTHPTETNKETRIIVNSDWIKKNVLFLDRSKYLAKSDYGRMMDFLLSYSVAGKNKHDDVPDGMANFALYVSRKFMRVPTVIIASPI